MLYFENSVNRYPPDCLHLHCYRLENGELSDTDATIFHNDMELLYSEAALTLYINDEPYDVAPGDIFFINPRQIHRAYRKTFGSIFAIVFDLPLLRTADSGNPVNRLLDDVAGQKKQFFPKAEQGSALYRELLPSLREITGFSNRPIPFGEESYRILSCLYSVTAACLKANFFREIKHGNLYSLRYILEIMDYIDQNFWDHLTAACLADRLKLSETYLYRLFREYIGVTPVNYINSIRILKACRFLENGTNVTQAAALAGFANVSYFIRLFREITGLTPRQWVSRKKQSI